MALASFTPPPSILTEPWTLIIPAGARLLPRDVAVRPGGPGRVGRRLRRRRGGISMII